MSRRTTSHAVLVRVAEADEDDAGTVTPFLLCHPPAYARLRHHAVRQNSDPAVTWCFSCHMEGRMGILFHDFGGAMICISINQESRRLALFDMFNAAGQCDLLEIRLDRFGK